MVSSLVQLQASAFPKAAGEQLVRLERQVVWIGMLWDSLLDDQDGETVDVAEYLNRQVDDLRLQFSRVSRLAGSGETRATADTSIDVQADELHLHMDRALPLGLLSGELIANALEQVGNNGARHLRVGLSCRGTGVMLEIKSRGRETVDKQLPAQAERLVSLLSSQLKAQLSFDRASDGETSAKLSFEI